MTTLQAMNSPQREAISFLESHVIFHGVPAQDLALMVPFLSFDTFEKGVAIIEESSEGNALYVITAGSVSVIKNLRDGPGRKAQTAKLAELGQGDSFGEMELLDTMKRSASVIANEKTLCLVLTTGTFLKLYDVRPEAYRIITLNLARELSRRLRVADIRIAELEEQLACVTSNGVEGS